MKATADQRAPDAGPVEKPVARQEGGPLYLRIAATLKDEIVSGIHPVGSQLPTEEALSERFAVSRYTIREALRRLREENLVASRQGAGTVVVPSKTSDSYVNNILSISDLVAFATGTHFAIDAIGTVTIDERLATRTGLPVGSEWLEVRGARYTHPDGAAFCWIEYYINRSYAAVGRLLQRHTGAIFPLIEDLFGVTVEEVQQQISATLITAVLAERLQVREGSAALEVQRTYRTSDGTIAQTTVNTYPALRFSHSTVMRRVKG